MARTFVSLNFDAEPMQKTIGSLLALIESSDRPVKIRRAFGKRVLKLLNEGLAFDFNGGTTVSTGEVVIRPEPSQRLLDLVAAFRAGD